MSGDATAGETPVYVGPTLGPGVRLHFRGTSGFEDLTEQRARRLTFDLAEQLGLMIYDPALLGEVAE
ncbi:hypothetical protein [Streptomyces sp. NPDC006785]|uniref:hypothetical protein n=1 Tax=Streptomyces sp. NPDC006785 TaxID=3155461 RepID=UPI00340C6088